MIHLIIPPGVPFDAAISFKTIQAYTTGAIFYVVLISVPIILQKQVERRIRG